MQDRIDTTLTAAANTGVQPSSESAFLEVLPEMLALAPDEVRSVNHDVPRLITSVLAAEPAIRSFDEVMAGELPKLPLARMSKLRTYAMALAYAHSLPITPVADAPARALLDEGEPLR